MSKASNAKFMYEKFASNVLKRPMVCLLKMKPPYMMETNTARLAKALAIFVSGKQAPMHMDIDTAEALVSTKMITNVGKWSTASVVEDKPIMK
mmetsp:Transcript_4567/g.7989  ORF Transcript_4567/g.7989 Transcript_4567/m.7989 type:complete len:93 (+) Transcript_4567:281-559(+)